MPKFLRLFAIMLLLTTVIACSKKEEAANKEQIEEIVKNYILNHPEVLLEAVKNYQQRSEQDQEKQAEEQLGKFQEQLFNNPNSPVYGNPKGTIQIVEFFDYNCGYCKRMVPDIKKLAAENSEVKFIFKELPILGPTSETAALAALVIHETAPDKYFDFHTALMQHDGPQDEAIIAETATKLGLDANKILAEMKQEKYRAILAGNMEIARALAIQGTPTFIVNNQIQRGAVGYEGLKATIAKQAQAK